MSHCCISTISLGPRNHCALRLCNYFVLNKYNYLVTHLLTYLIPINIIISLFISPNGSLKNTNIGLHNERYKINIGLQQQHDSKIKDPKTVSTDSRY